MSAPAATERPPQPMEAHTLRRMVSGEYVRGGESSGQAVCGRVWDQSACCQPQVTQAMHQTEAAVAHASAHPWVRASQSSIHPTAAHPPLLAVVAWVRALRHHCRIGDDAHRRACRLRQQQQPGDRGNTAAVEKS